MSELEIRAVIENCKINKATKESLLQIGKNNDKKFQALENEILNLKNQYENKIKELEISIKSTQKTHEKVSFYLSVHRKIFGVKSWLNYFSGHILFGEVARLVIPSVNVIGDGIITLYLLI